MADVAAAIDYVLRQEDATLSGVITIDDGGKTRFGIAERYHPELANSLFYESMGSVAALVVARGIYEKQYCDELCISDILSQDVANKVLSLGVNIGVVPAAKMLQSAVNVPGDGRVGPLTLYALDSANSDDVLNLLRLKAHDYYVALVDANPKLAVYLNGWEARALA